MQKISKAFSFYLGLVIISITIQSCCSEEYKITGNGELKAFQLDYTPVDTVTSEFILSSLFESELIGMRNDFGIIQTSYATSCDYTYFNSLDRSTAELILDKDIIFDGETITAGTNFILSEGIDFDNTISFGANMEIRLTADFLNNAVFEKENYTFKVKVTTDDGLELEHEITLPMDL